MLRASRVVREFSAPTMAAALVLVAALVSVPAAGAEFSAGAYSFSDELGGFRLLSASGNGTSDDPIVISEEILDVAPVTLVIRNRDFLSMRGQAGQAQLTLVKKVTNRSVRVWAGFELELQEVLGKPSDYGDGLSFKQFAAEPSDVASDVFAKNERRFEPYDRIEFTDGHLDPDATGTFKVTITDPTPVPEYYLVQDPKLLSAGLPLAGPQFAKQ
jgi:hypothetical protein